jgi:hypothetical protein
MKKLVTAIGLLAVLASPVLAKSHPAEQRDARAAYAQSVGAPSDAVVVDGKVVGQDPDPNVRLELMRDHVSEY